MFIFIQFPIGLFDCNETKTQDAIQLLKNLTEKYVPLDEDNVIDEVFFGGKYEFINPWLYIQYHILGLHFISDPCLVYVIRYMIFVYIKIFLVFSHTKLK